MFVKCHVKKRSVESYFIDFKHDNENVNAMSGRGPRIPQEGPTCPHATARQTQKLNTVGVDDGIIVAA